MTQIQDITHPVQLAILQQLLLKPNSRFRDLNTTELTNDHFTFHLKRLAELGLIAKSGTDYTLTPQGLELAGRIDTKTGSVPTQPKLGVAVTCIQRDQPIKFLLGKRKKDPSLGKVGWFTEKVVLGESLTNAARRCLLTETGLEAERLFCAGVSRFVESLAPEAPIAQDVMLVCFVVEAWSGTLEAETAESTNAWYTMTDLNRRDDLFAGLIQQLGSVQYNKYIFHDMALIN